MFLLLLPPPPIWESFSPQGHPSPPPVVKSEKPSIITIILTRRQNKPRGNFSSPPPPKSRIFPRMDTHIYFPIFSPKNFQTEKNAAVVPDQHVTFSNSSASFDFAHIFVFFLLLFTLHHHHIFFAQVWGGESIYVCTDIFSPTQKGSFFAYIDTGMGENSNDV